MITNRIKHFLKRYYPFFTLALFAVYTLIIIFSRTPFWDEAHQIDIARLSVLEIFKIVRIIGHPALWYLIIKPFSSPNLYPYSIYILNWLFCMGAVIFLWTKSPFDLLNKTLITFSVPFLYFFAPVARCYGLAILLFFILCNLFPFKSRYPYKIALILFICANTSFLSIIGCIFLGILQLYDLYIRNSKNLKNIILLYFVFSLVILLQLWGAKKPYPLESSEYIARLCAYFLIKPLWINLQSFLLHLPSGLMIYIMPIYFFRKSKQALFFICGTFLCLTSVFAFAYSGSYWNYYFYYIFFIMTFWMFHRKLLSDLFVKILFTSVLFMCCSPKALLSDIINTPYLSHSKEIANYILNNNSYLNAKLYVLEGWSDISPGADIYLLKNNIYLYDIYNRRKISYESLKEIHKLNYETVNMDRLFAVMDNNSYLLANSDFQSHKFNSIKLIKKGHDFYLYTKDNNFLIKLIDSRDDINLYIYKILKIPSYDRINL